MPLKEKFVGTWTLLSWKIEQAGGEIIDSPLGPNPAGWIMYQRDGRMSVNIMRSDRAKFASDSNTFYDSPQHPVTRPISSWHESLPPNPSRQTVRGVMSASGP